MAQDGLLDDNSVQPRNTGDPCAITDSGMPTLNAEPAAGMKQPSQPQTISSSAQHVTGRAFETARYYVIGLDSRGRVETFNQEALQVLGLTKQALLGKDWFELVLAPERRAEWRAHFHAAGSSQPVLVPHWSSLTHPQTGELREIEWQYSFLERDGDVASCVAIGVDITVRQRAQQALSASEIRYRRLFETAKDGILILDATTGRVVDANPYLSELLGMTFDQLLGKKVWELGFLKDVAASRENFLELQQHEYIRYEDLPLETANGQRIDAEFVSNVYRVNGDLVIQCNIRNITARKHAEDELQQLHAELESRVAERTAELAQANLALKSETVERMRAEEMQLTAVLEERTRIAREIHDTLAQGFAGIILQLEAAEDVMAGKPQLTHSHLVKARQLARDSLVDARRYMWALRPQMLEKGDLVYAISVLVEGLAKHSSISIEFAHQGQRSKLPKNIEDGLLRICQEALMNAGKHSQAKHIRAILEFSATQVELRIEDDGRGFDAKSVPFLRGLGIRIMNERAEKMDGTFTVISQPGQGTQILVRVPLSAGENGGNHG